MSMTKDYTYPEGDGWNWRKDSPFAHAVGVGDQVFVSGQQTLDASGNVLDAGNIASQTRNVFENMKNTLSRYGLGFEDLVRINTYYVFDGAEEDATQYWEDMTQIRLQYFPDPGPVGTAVRIKAMPYEGQLIQIEGVAIRGESSAIRQRIMPAGSWDWSIPIPLSQGWRVGERIFVGGQISADEQGKSVHVGDLSAQTHNIFKFIGNVLNDAGASMDDIVHVKVCFKHDSLEPSGQTFADKIMEIAAEYTPGNGSSVLAAFGVDLLYPGLDLEIDAMAIVDPTRRPLRGSATGGRYQPNQFSDGVSAAGEIYVGGQTALGVDGSIQAGSDIAGQARIVFERLASVLAADGATLNDVVKLNLFFVADAARSAEAFHTISAVWADVAPNAHPAMTPVRVHELAREGLLVQADCIALK